MNVWGWVSRRLAVLFRKDSAEHELDDEIAYHIEMETRQNIKSGMDPEEARRRALVAFGGVERFKEEVRDVRGARLIDDLIQDVRVAARAFLKQPAFLAAVLLTLGIGIGSNVAMFGVLDASLFSALPYPDSDRLVLGRVTWDGEVGGVVSGADFLDFRAQNESFEGLAAMTPWEISHTVTGRGEPHRVRSMYVSPGIFQTLGVMPHLGRDFRREDGAAGAPPVVMLDHGYWTRSHGAAPDIVGASISVNGLPAEVAGVMPPGFRIIQDVDLFLVFHEDDGWAQARQYHNFSLIGRLRSDRTVTAAQADVDVIASQLAAAFPGTNEGKGLNLAPLREALIEDYTSVLGMLMAAVGLVLLIACGNVAGLLLARGSARRAEMAIRSVMGAGRGRLARQLLAENTLLALGAGVLGLLLAVWLQRGILAFVSLDSLGAIEPSLSGTTLLFAFVLSALTVGIFGAIPAWNVARTDRAQELRSGTRTAGSRRSTRFRSSMVVAQVALTVVLLAGSGLLLRSFVALSSVDPGFRTESLLTAEIVLPRDTYQEPESRVQFYDRFVTGVERLPGVQSATLVSLLPIRDPLNNVIISKPETFGERDGAQYTAYVRTAWPGYFEAMGISMVAGRTVEVTDDHTNTPVIVLSEETVRGVFGEENPLGQLVAVDVGQEEPELREVVGVVSDVVTTSLEWGVGGAMYRPYHQSIAFDMRVAVRVAGDATAVTNGVRAVLRDLEPNVPLSAVATMDDVISQSVSGQRAITTVLALFAVVALLLASLGLYSVQAYQVARRRHEIGVRMALGATVDGVAGGVLRSGMVLAAGGLAIGIPIAVVASRVLESSLFGVEAVDPITYAVVSVFLALITALACLLPARRAARVDPVAAFRTE